MSIPLSLLVQLAHDLSEGRKRRREWEEEAAQGRRCKACGAAEAPAEGGAPAGADAAEMRLMRNASNAFDKAKPIPLAAPVTTAALPLTSMF